ncbi:MAG: TatD family hydrolase [Eubacteriales bacterium]
MRLFDTHAHVTDEALDSARKDILLSLNKDLAGFMECATCLNDMDKVVSISKENERVFCAVGVHPHEAKDFGDLTVDKIKKLLDFKRTVAIGEIGLDYHYEFSPKDVQKDVFEKQLSLAKSLKVPVVIHMREATKDTIDILKAHSGVNGVFHCFSGSKETAKIALDMGFYISFSGTVTFSNAVSVVEAADYVPIDRLMAETDSPYLSPQPFRGKTNRPENVRYTIEKLSQIKGISFEEMREINIVNFKRLFNVLEKYEG